MLTIRVIIRNTVSPQSFHSHGTLTSDHCLYYHKYINFTLLWSRKLKPRLSGMLKCTEILASLTLQFFLKTTMIYGMKHSQGPKLNLNLRFRSSYSFERIWIRGAVNSSMSIASVGNHESKQTRGLVFSDPRQQEPCRIDQCEIDIHILWFKMHMWLENSLAFLWFVYAHYRPYYGIL